MQQLYMNNANALSTRGNHDSHRKRYFEFCDFEKSTPFPTNQFKIAKFATYLADILKTVESIKAYCRTICDDHELKGFPPVRLGLLYNRTIAGIRRNRKHNVKRAEPMTVQLLEKVQKVVNTQVQKELVCWKAATTCFHSVLRKSNIVPVKRQHDPIHNISRKDVRYDEGAMVIFVRWSKTDQLGQEIQKIPLIANKNSDICPVCWILQMTETIPAHPNHNLFSFHSGRKILPITYRDLTVQMRSWLQKIGKKLVTFSSHSLRRGASSHAFDVKISETILKKMGNWSSDCYRHYIEINDKERVKASMKFNNFL